MRPGPGNRGGAGSPGLVAGVALGGLGAPGGPIRGGLTVLAGGGPCPGLEKAPAGVHWGGHCRRGSGRTATSEHFGSLGRGLRSRWSFPTLPAAGVSEVGVALRGRTLRGS